jgi:hypothetical protein
MAALYDPSQPMNLQTQVLTHVTGSVAWKGLINHEHGPDYVDAKVKAYRDLHANILSRLGGFVPTSGLGWYAYYNGLDTCWGWRLAQAFKEKLTAQGRWRYYVRVTAPLQAPLRRMGATGMPVDETRVLAKRKECASKVAASTKILVEAGAAMLTKQARAAGDAVNALEAEKAREAATTGSKKFGKAKELTAARTKLRSFEGKSFNPDSPTQRCALLYEWYGLPPIKNKGAKGLTSDDTAVEDLISRLERGTIKPKCGTKDEVIPVLQAMIDVKRWSTLERTFLRPVLR